MPMREVNGTELYYEDTGHPPGSTGETLVFSHGLLWSTAQFAPQVEALRARYRCISWDHRGQGKSAADPLRETIGIELVWQDAAALLDALDTGPVHFCGLSMGGFVAMRMAARRPDLVRSLLLLETTADPEPPENVPRYRLLTRVVRLTGTRLVRHRIPPIMLGRSTCTDPARRADLARFTDIMAARRDIWRAVNGVIDRAAIRPELGQITAPTLVVVGEEDTATTPAKAEALVAALPAVCNAQLVRIPRAGHSSSVEQPEAVTEAISSFLGSLAARAN